MKRRDRTEWFNEFRKIPRIRFNRLRMDELEDLEELTKNYEPQASVHQPKPAKGEHYPEYHFTNIKELVYFAADKYGDKTCVLDKDKPRDKEWKEYSFARVLEDANKLGTALISRYIEKGQPIAIIGENQYDWYISYVAALLGAGIAVPLDKELPENEIELCLNRSHAAAVIYSPKLKDKFKHLMEDGRLPEVRCFIEMRSDDDRRGRHAGLHRVITEGELLMAGGSTEFTDIEIDPDKFCALFFTSGTTADAKGVMANSRQLANNVNAVSAYVNITSDDRFLSVLPLHHTYESSIGFLVMFGMGSSVAVCQGLRYISDNMKEVSPTFIIAVPLLIDHLYAAIQKNIKKSGKDKLVSSMMQATNVLNGIGIDIRRQVFREIYEGLGGRLRCIVSAAAPIDPKVGKWFSDLGIMFIQGYGLTETTPISAVTPDFVTNVSSAGKTIINGIVRVDDPDENGEGELVISTDTLMMGYYEDEAATAEVIEIDENGRRWFHSGDIGRVEGGDVIYVTGRIKNVIVTQNGKNIYPEELELLLNNSPIINEVMVYGREIPGNKELTVTARVIPEYDEITKLYGDKSTDEIYDLLMEEIRAVNKKVTGYKAVKALEIKDGAFIKTSTQKIKRFMEIKEGRILQTGK